MKSIEPSTCVKARVGICVTTFKRPDLLRQLLVGLSQLTFDRMPTPEILVVIVDNDISRSAAEICDAAQLPWKAKYVVESRRGISQARNRAIREAEDPDYLVFIDDDEVPTPAWLDELLWAQSHFDSDVVCGPVIPRFATGVPEWVKTGRFFMRNTDTNGRPVEFCGSGNVLISREVINSIPSFDERFAFTGGEDTQFFLRVRRAGFSIVCSEGGVVYETIPASRASMRYLLRRAYQGGNSWVLCESSLDCRMSTRMSRIAKAGGRIVQGALSACLSPVYGKAALAHALSTLFVGVGMMAALTGRNFQPYQSAGTDTSQG
jgi:GT2 family glycosyltransferase